MSASEFSDLVLKLSKAETTATSSADLQNRFLSAAERQGPRLPPNASLSLVDKYLQVMT